MESPRAASLTMAACRASYEDSRFPFRGVHACSPPGGLLFCIGQGLDVDSDEIIALDAQSLQPRYRFGLMSLLNGAADMVVTDDLLVVCDT